VANFLNDASSSYISSAALFATSTGVTTNAHLSGVSVDLAGNVGNGVTVFLISGNAGGTSPTMDAKVRESTDGTTYTDVTNGAFTQVTTHNQVQALAVKPTKRYLSVTGTVGGTSPVFEATFLILAPRRTAPADVGGFNQTAAGS